MRTLISKYTLVLIAIFITKSTFGSDIKILFYNTYLVGGLWGKDHFEHNRAKEISKELKKRQYDIIGFAEASFNNDLQNKLLKDIDEDYPHKFIPKFEYLLSSPITSVFHVFEHYITAGKNSGLMLLSKYPIIDKHFESFEKKLWLSLEYYSQKGVLYARLEIEKNKYIDIFLTHLQSDGSNNLIEEAHEIRNQQLKQLAKLIHERKDENIPIIIMGDFNMGPTSTILKNFLHSLATEENSSLPIDHLGGSDDPTFFGQANNLVGGYSYTRYDYIISQNNKSNELKINKTNVEEFKAKQERPYTHLSDHFAVETFLKY